MQEMVQPLRNGQPTILNEKPITVIVTCLEEVPLSKPALLKPNEVMSHFQASLEKNYCLGKLLAK